MKQTGKESLDNKDLTVEKLAKNEDLFAFFAYKKSIELNPEVYEAVDSPEEWLTLIQDDVEMQKLLVEEALKLEKEDWINLYDEYSSKTAPKKDVQIAAKGMKTKYKKVPVKKKCSCGCDLVISKSIGGKLAETCACKCGGKIKH